MKFLMKVDTWTPLIQWVSSALEFPYPPFGFSVRAWRVVE